MKSINILLVFNSKIMYKPIIYKIAKDFNITFNLLEATILPKQEGRIILELKGENSELDKCLEYIKKEGVNIQYLADKIHRNEESCTHCGACTAVCVTDALYIEKPGMKVLFDSEKCIACGLCTKACPVKAMSEISISSL